MRPRAAPFGFTQTIGIVTSLVDALRASLRHVQLFLPHVLNMTHFFVKTLTMIFVKTLTMLWAQQMFRLYCHLTTNTRSLWDLGEVLRGLYRKNQDIRVVMVVRNEKIPVSMTDRASHELDHVSVRLNTSSCAAVQPLDCSWCSSLINNALFL